MLEFMSKKPYPQQDLAQLIAQAMDDSGVSQADLARRCGITIQSVNQWRKTGRISKQHLFILSQATGRSLEYFLLGLGRAAVLVLALFLGALLWPHESFAADHKALFFLAKAPTVYYVKLKRAILRALQFLHELLHSSDVRITLSSQV